MNGLASASALFLVAVGLALIFGVTRVVNFAHGAFLMLGLYLAIHLQQGIEAAFVLEHLGSKVLAYWGSILGATLLVAALAALLERTVLRRLYAVPELFQLLATFSWVLIAQDAVLWFWGAEEVLGPRAPGLGGAVMVGERSVPVYDLVLIACAPLIGAALYWLLRRTVLGLQIRAASEDREMAQALGVKQGVLFCATFAVGCGLAALGGALQMPREPASTSLALAIVGDAFVVVVIGGMGSLKGAYIAALTIGLLKALCIALGTVEVLGVALAFPKLTQVLEFVFMAAVLMVRPQGLFGLAMPAAAVGGQSLQEHRSLRALSPLLIVGLAVIVLAVAGMASALPQGNYVLTLLLDMAVAYLFALSLHWLLAPAGMASFGHAALFGVGAYAAALAMPLGLIWAGLISGTGAAVMGILSAALTMRMQGVYRAMLTLAIAQLLWSASIQWDGLTGGSNGLTGVWPQAPFDSNQTLLYVALIVCVVVSLAGYWALQTRWGLQIRALRDSPQRAISLGMQPVWLRGSAFAASGWIAGLAGALYVATKGTVAPDALSVHQSVQGLVMVLLGGFNSLTGALSGAVTWTLVSDWLLRNVPYWRAALGAMILLAVLFLPNGVSGWLEALRSKRARAMRLL